VYFISLGLEGPFAINENLEQWSSDLVNAVNAVNGTFTSLSGNRTHEATTHNGDKFIFINNKYPNPSGYQNILNDMSPEDFSSKPLKERCSLYFSRLYDNEPDWALKELESGYPYNGYIFDTKERFLQERKNEYKNTLENKDDIKDEDLDKLVEKFGKKFEWELSYQKAFKESYDTEKYMTDQITNLRVFSQCYLGDISREEQQSIDSFNKTITCEANEKRLFKFLTLKFPTYKRWNKEVLSVPPVIEDYLNDTVHTTSDERKLHQLSGCFTRDLKNTYNGKGIVISAADKHVEELSSLLLVLRGLRNKLPIQIVHRGDLSLESQKTLTKVSRSDDLNLDEIPSFKKIVQKFYSDIHDLSTDIIFPKQEIWYVDISSAISPDDKRFVTYGNKLLTLLFSSFEDTVLIDTDTVPFVDIDKFILQSSVYQDLGAFFFKDRQLYDKITGPELTYFRKLLPTRLDTALFGIPELTKFTYENRFFGDHYKHIQESGMVAINKKRHIRSTLAINILQMWHATTTRVHGDKELFWLGFSVAGDEDYYLNKHGVGAVGSLNPNSNRLLGDENDSRRSKLKSHMLCTTHPAHLSGLDDHTLLWMNSGFVTCKRPDEAGKDIKMDLYKNVFKNEEKLKQTYVSPLKIKAVVVPPPQERVINNELGEPASGWEVMFGCGGYLYCAYDSVGGSDDSHYQGTLVEYDDDQILWYDYLGELWVYLQETLKKD
jgi:hypothetical protein